MWTPVEQQQHGGGKAVESDHTDRKLKETFSRLKEPILGFFLGRERKIRAEELTRQQSHVQVGVK